MRHDGNGGRHPDEILADIERTRREMDSTLGAIEERLTPGQLLDQGMDYLKQSGAVDYARNLRGAVTEHPLPVALVGIGLAWLAATDRMDRRPARYGARSSSRLRQEWNEEHAHLGEKGSHLREKGAHLTEEASGMLQRAKEGASSLRERASGAVGSMREHAGGTAGSMRERASGALESGRQAFDSTSRMARERMGELRGSYDRIVNEQPLALGAIGLAVGAMLAAFLPRTRKEEELLAGTRERVADKASELARQASEKGKEALEKGRQPVEQAGRETVEQTKPPEPARPAASGVSQAQSTQQARQQPPGTQRPPAGR